MQTGVEIVVVCRLPNADYRKFTRTTNFAQWWFDGKAKNIFTFASRSSTMDYQISLQTTKLFNQVVLWTTRIFGVIGTPV